MLLLFTHFLRNTQQFTTNPKTPRGNSGKHPQQTKTPNGGANGFIFGKINRKCPKMPPRLCWQACACLVVLGKSKKQQKRPKHIPKTQHPERAFCPATKVKQEPSSHPPRSKKSLLPTRQGRNRASFPPAKVNKKPFPKVKKEPTPSKVKEKPFKVKKNALPNLAFRSSGFPRLHLTAVKLGEIHDVVFWTLIGT